MRLAIHVENELELKKAFIDASVRGSFAWHAAAYLAATEIMMRALPSVPVDSGDLLGSAYVTRSREVWLGFNNWKASIVHEGPRGTKFLQRTWSASEGGLAQRMAELWPQCFERGWDLRTVPGVFPTEAPKGKNRRKVLRRRRAKARARALAAKKRTTRTQRRRS